MGIVQTGPERFELTVFQTWRSKNLVKDICIFKRAAQDNHFFSVKFYRMVKLNENPYRRRARGGSLFVFLKMIADPKSRMKGT